MAAIAIYDWQTVPTKVAKLLPLAAAAYVAHEKAAAVSGLLATTAAMWRPDDNTLRIRAEQYVGCAGLQAYAARVKEAGYATQFCTTVPDWSREILIKRGSMAIPGVKQLWSLGNKALAGPSPLSNGLVSSLLLGGLGYGTGALAEKLFPERFGRRKQLRKRFGLLGALGGAGVGAINAYANSRALKQPIFSGLVSNNRTPVVYPFEKAAYTMGYGFNPADPMVPDAIGLHQPIINVPQFNTLMWRDARNGMINPYGPYGSHTPPPLAAAATGLTQGISVGLGTPLLSPHDLVRGFVAAGASPTTANVAGRTLGALAALSPTAQYQLQNSGVWGSVVSTVVPPLFGHGRF